MGYLGRCLASSWLLLGMLAACNRAAGKECRELMASAQNVVNGIDSSSLDSVEQALASVNQALTACENAGQSTEASRLKSARDEIAAHHEKLKNRKPKEKKSLSSEEIADLVKRGDPGCPKGMAYRPQGSDKEVRCTGPVPAHMPWALAESYFKKRGYKVTPGDEPSSLKVEYGAELLVFKYAEPNSTKAPLCLTLYPEPGVGWQEATARATGTPPYRLTKNGSVWGPNGELKLSVVEDEAKLIVRIGSC